MTSITIGSTLSNPAQWLLRLLSFFQSCLRDGRLDISIISYCNHNFFYQCFGFRQKRIQMIQMHDYIADVFVQSFKLFFSCQFLRFNHVDIHSFWLIFRLNAILINLFLTLFDVTHTFFWGFQFSSQIARLRDAIFEFSPLMNSMR